MRVQTGSDLSAIPRELGFVRNSKIMLVVQDTSSQKGMKSKQNSQIKKKLQMLVSVKKNSKLEN